VNAFPAATIAAVATPPGRGGIGVVRVSGGNLDALVVGIVGRMPPARVATLATFRGAHGEPLDQGVALYFPAPRSYTGETVLELHGHGGPAVLRLVLARCVELGARLAEPGEFTKRAFLNGKLDLAQAEGVADLIEAATATAARAAARSLCGEFSREVNAIVAALTELRMFVEATLDFPEEDIEFVRAADARGKLAALRARIDRLLAQSVQGALLRDGLAVVLVGQPNVGKSSLLNRLAGEDLAIVTPIAGTTRDTVQSQLELAGIPLTVIDTAGLRPTDDPIETLGVARAWQAVGRANLALVLVDASSGDDVGAADTAILDQLPAALPRIVVHNKIDVTETAAQVRSVREAGGANAAEPARRHVYLSAKTGAGLDLLRQEILAVAGAHEDMEGTFLARERHLVALRAAAAHLEAAAAHLEAAVPPLELFAEELREAQQAVAAITGEFTADDLLGEIFSRFCIGK
jgi:tRNA modification GTPase